MQNRNTRSPVPALMFAVSVVGSNGLALSPILSDVARSFSTTPLTISTAISAYGAATAASAFFLAARIDRIGIRRTLLGGMLALIAALLLSAAAPHWLALTLAQAVAGTAAGVILPAAYGSASLIAQPGQEARTLGRVIAGWSVSLVAGVPLSALISDAIGWRATYGVLALCAAVALLGLRRLPERRAAHPAPLRLSRLLAPLSYRDVPALLLGCLAFSSAFYGVYAFLADHVRRLLALSAGQVGFIAFAYGAGFMLSGLLGARLIERLGPRRAAAGAGRRRADLPGAAARRAGAAGRAAHRRRLGRGLAAVPEPAGAAAVARPPRGTRRGAGPEHLRHLPGRQPGHRRRRHATPMPALARWPGRQRRRRGRRAGIALAPERAPRACSRQHRSPRQRLKRPVSRPRLPAGLFVPVGYAAVARGSVTSPRPSRSGRQSDRHHAPSRRRPTDPFRHLPGGHPQPGPDAEAAARGLCADIAGLTRSVGVRAADDTLSCVMGIGSRAWDRLFGAPRPKELHPFREINGVHHAPPRPATCCSTCAPSAWTSVSSCPR